MGLLIGVGNTVPRFAYTYWYGIRGDSTSTDPILERIGNLDLHRTLPIQNRIKRFIENEDGTVKTYLNSNDSRLTISGDTAILDGTEGNVMLEKPEYYFRLEVVGTQWSRMYSEYPLPGFIKMERKSVSPWYATFNNVTNEVASVSNLIWDGDEIKRGADGYPEFTANAANYRGGSNSSAKDGAANSQLGTARTAVSKATVRSYCKNGTHIGTWRVMNEIAWLMRLEYANNNCQSGFNPNLTSDGYKQGGIGTGAYAPNLEWKEFSGYYPFIPNGVTATIGNNSGLVNYTITNWKDGLDKIVHANSYRGLELPFCYLYSLCDDILIYNNQTNGTSKAYVCDDCHKFTSPADASTEIPDGYKLTASLPLSDGWISQESHTSDGYSFPSSVGAGTNSTTGYCDYFYTGFDNGYTGWFGALCFGSASAGTSAGFGYLNTNSRSSNASAYSGFRLCRN